VKEVPVTQDRQSPAPDRQARRRLTLTTSVAAIALVALGAVGSQLPVFTSAAARAATAAPAVTANANPSSGFADLIASVRPAVVSVKVQLEQPVSMNGNGGGNMLPFNPFNPFGPFGMPNTPRMPQGNQRVVGEGSGFFISSDGTIVTANHVVDHAQKVQVTTSDGKTYAARVIGTDPGTDIAVLKVDAGNNFSYVKFADKMPRVGDWVVAIGNPFGLGNTATAGIVSATGRNINMSTYDNYLQIDAPINRGNSGGPTFDMQGHVVGINDAIFTPSGGSVGIGFDVPSSIARTIVAQIEKSGHVTRGWIGVQVQDVTQPIADSLGMKQAEGALVATPEPGGPAAKAGIHPGDVITAVNGSTVKDSRALAQEIAGLLPGSSVKLDVLSNGHAKTITLTLGDMPSKQQNPPA
jgi:serine protease Do